MCVFEKEKTHKSIIVAHMVVTVFCCLEMILQQYQVCIQCVFVDGIVKVCYYDCDFCDFSYSYVPSSYVGF